MLNVRLRMTLMVAGLGLGWSLIAPPAAAAQCTYDVFPSSVDDVAAAGASGSLTVGWSQPPLPLDVDLLCGDTWVAGNTPRWISISTSLTDNSILYYTVDANPTASARTGTITVSGQTVTITQLANPCLTPQVSPTSLSFGSAGGSQTVTVQGAATCTYDVTASKAWIKLSSTTVAGGGSVTVTVGRYTGSTVGSGTVTIGSTSIPVGQCPGSPGVSPASLLFSSAGGMRTVGVQEAATCTYPVSANKAWIGVAPTTVAGNGTVTVTVTVQPYTGTTERSGTVTIDTRSVPVTQPPPTDPCASPPSPTVIPSSLSFSSAAGSKTVTVSGSSDCSHPVSDDQTWISVPSSVSGGDSMTVSVTENTSTDNRSGMVTIRATSMQVTQAGTTQPPVPNAAPVAVDDAATTQTNTPVPIAVLDNDTDADNDALTVAAVVQAPTQGTAVVDTGGQTITYTPPMTDWTGVTEFRYRVTDGSRTAVATVTVTVTPANRPPTANAGRNRTAAVGTIVRLNGSLSRDPDSDSLQYQWTQTSGPEVVLLHASHFYRATTGLEVIFTAPATPGDDDLEFSLVVTDARGATSEPATVTVTVLGAVLTQHRERLLADLASRGGRTGGVCALWNSLNRQKKEVFLWNTHRLYITGMLPDVTKLYAIYGAEGAVCGGDEYNRTFMSMTAELRDKMLLVARDNNTTVLSTWRETWDPACGWVNSIPIAELFLGPCPHPPFTRQIETSPGKPRGQINFFGEDLLRVSRTYRGLEGVCGTETMIIRRSNLCPAGDSCSGAGSYAGCAVSYTDTLVGELTTYTRGPDNDPVTISDKFSFEMDQDYGFRHRSAPHCNGMRSTYSYNYGHPNWGWRPSGCSPVTVPEADPEDPFATGLAVTIRADDVTVLRDRVNALRQRFDLAAFSWTDATITPEVTPVKAVHLTELRTALNEAYRSATRSVPTYTDAVITPRVTPVRMIHLTELRRAVVALEQ